MQDAIVLVPTRTCMMCGKAGEVWLPAAGLTAYRNGAFIQDAFRGVSEEVREQFQSGLHPGQCQDAVFGTGEDD